MMMAEEGMSSGEGGSGGRGGLQQGMSSGYHPYPPPLATYEDIVTSRDLFMDTLRKLHAYMATKFMIPVVGGRDLDLHRLFVEVTSRGGIAKVVKDRKWKEVTSVFSFPSSATNASFILRKYYISLLYHYEQIYFFKAKCWTPSPTDAIQHLATTAAAPSAGVPEYVHSVAQPAFTTSQQQRASASEGLFAPSAGAQVCGIIDGKFDGGYLITVRIGSEEFKGVMYQVPDGKVHALSSHHMRLQTPAESAQFFGHSLVKAGPPRRRRRKKSEIRKRDPAHPKPNRSGYNFFFAEQHAKLKPHYHGKDREISRIIGESWNKLQEHERAIYQEKALKDKERYRLEMEDYRERLRTGQIVGNTTLVQQQSLVLQPPISATPSSNVPYEGGATSAYTDENEASSDKSNLEEYDSGDKDSEIGECSQGDMDLKNVNVEMVVDEAFMRPNQIQQGDKQPESDNNMPSADETNVVGGMTVVPVEQLGVNGGEAV